MKRLTFQFPVNKVKAALLFAGVSDIRAYLNGVLFQRQGDGMVAVGTDGHRLSAIYDANCDVGGVDSDTLEPNDIPEGFAVIVERAQLAQAIKAHSNRAMPVLIFHVEWDETVSGPRTVRVLADFGATKIEAKEVEQHSRILQWQAIIPPLPYVASGETPSFNAKYLADYAKLAALLGNVGFPMVRVLHRGPNDSAVIDVGSPDVISIVMPVRDGGMSYQEWFYGPKPEPVELREAA